MFRRTDGNTGDNGLFPQNSQLSSEIDVWFRDSAPFDEFASTQRIRDPELLRKSTYDPCHVQKLSGVAVPAPTSSSTVGVCVNTVSTSEIPSLPSNESIEPWSAENRQSVNVT
jgi:hypothetical protein